MTKAISSTAQPHCGVGVHKQFHKQHMCVCACVCDSVCVCACVCVILKAFSGSHLSTTSIAWFGLFVCFVYLWMFSDEQVVWMSSSRCSHWTLYVCVCVCVYVRVCE